MRLTKLRVKNFRRFKDESINLDAPVISIVGPNEAGKTSILRALTSLSSPSPLGIGDTTRGRAESETRIEGVFLLDERDSRELASVDRSLSRARWITVSRNHEGDFSYSLNLPMPADAENAVKDILPPILEFTDDDRSLRTEYDLRERTNWNKAIHNLAEMAGCNLNQLAEAAIGSRHDIQEEILVSANEVLEMKFSQTWSQSRLQVRLNVSGNTHLRVFASTDKGQVFHIADRSDGLRAFVALIAFLESEKPHRTPLLVLDEAENHLHWDAQADLVDVFHQQTEVLQVIYSTHSPGCLPNDLGNGVRAVVHCDQSPDRSRIDNWVWEKNAGYRPLLLRMGASTAALTPHRKAVITEGVSDFIVLPALLRAATDCDALEYQVVPGISQLSRSGVPRLDAESDAVVYLVDGDQGGRDNRKVLIDGGVPQERIHALPEDAVLEDLVAETTLIEAINEELRRSGHDLILEEELGSATR